MSHAVPWPNRFGATTLVDIAVAAIGSWKVHSDSGIDAILWPRCWWFCCAVRRHHISAAPTSKINA